MTWFLPSMPILRRPITLDLDAEGMRAFFQSGGRDKPPASTLREYKELAVRIVEGIRDAPASKATEGAIKVQSQRIKMIDKALKEMGQEYEHRYK